MKPKISIIVPIYNAEEYINSCIESLLNQSFVDYEIVLIDDGSTDKSFQICKKIQSTDRRIKLFHQENQGVSSARKLGVAKSAGEYIFFMDADDTVQSIILEVLYDKISMGYDMVQCESSISGECSGVEFVNKMLKRQAPPNIWGKLIRRNLLDGNIMSIPSWIKIGEDYILNIRLGLIMNKIYSIAKSYYNYQQHPNSVMRTRCMSLDYEERFLQYVEDELGTQMQFYAESFKVLQLASLEGLIVSKINIDYNTPWIKKLLNSRILFPLNRRQWLVFHVRNSFICRYMLALERRIGLLLNVK